MRLTTCLFCLDLAALLLLIHHQLYLFGWIQTSQTGGQLYSDTSPYGECSLHRSSFVWVSIPYKYDALLFTSNLSGYSDIFVVSNMRLNVPTCVNRLRFTLKMCFSVDTIIDLFEQRRNYLCRQAFSQALKEKKAHVTWGRGSRHRINHYLIDAFFIQRIIPLDKRPYPSGFVCVIHIVTFTGLESNRRFNLTWFCP